MLIYMTLLYTIKSAMSIKLFSKNVHPKIMNDWIVLEHHGKVMGICIVISINFFYGNFGSIFGCIFNWLFVSVKTNYKQREKSRKS